MPESKTPIGGEVGLILDECIGSSEKTESEMLKVRIVEERIWSRDVPSAWDRFQEPDDHALDDHPSAPMTHRGNDAL